MEFNLNKIYAKIIEANSKPENFSELSEKMISNYLKSCEELGFIEKENVLSFKKIFFEKVENIHFTEAKITPFHKYAYSNSFLLFSIGSCENDVDIELNFYKAVTEMFFECNPKENIALNNAIGNLVAQKVYEHINNISLLPSFIEEQIGNNVIKTKREFFQYNYFQILFKQLLLYVGISETHFIKKCFNNGYNEVIEEVFMVDSKTTHFCKYLEFIFLEYKESVLSGKTSDQ